jgi:hypothetical protein
MIMRLSVFIEETPSIGHIEIGYGTTSRSE